jgi:hypothetical protein
MSAMPSDAHALAFFPDGNARANLINNTSHLMSGNARVLNTGPSAFFSERIAMADTASLHANPYVASSRGRNFAFDQLEIGSRRADLDCFHFGHGAPSLVD